MDRESFWREDPGFFPVRSLGDLGTKMQSWWGNLGPEERLAEVVGALMPGPGGKVKRTAPFFSFLSRSLEEAVGTGKIGRLLFPKRAAGGTYHNLLKKIGVSPDELKYTGMHEFLVDNMNKPVQLEDILELAKYRELKMNIQELRGVATDWERKPLEDAQARLVRQATLTSNRRRSAAMFGGADRLEQRLIKMESPENPALHGAKKYPTYNLEWKGRTAPGYRERLYSPDSGGISLEPYSNPHYGRSSQAEQVAAHARGHNRSVILPSGEEIMTTNLEEFQSDLHQRGTRVGYKGVPLSKKDTLDTFWDIAKGDGDVAGVPIAPGVEMRLVHLGDELGAPQMRVYFEGADKTEEYLLYTKEGFRNVFSDVSDSAGIEFNHRRPEITKYLERYQVPDYPFKSDWHKPILRDWMKQAAMDPNSKGLSISTPEIMAGRNPRTSRMRDELNYGRKAPQFIEQEYGITPIKVETQTGTGPGGEKITSPVWFVPIDEKLRRRLLEESQRLSLRPKLDYLSDQFSVA
jgi:hypothetical protein